MKRTVQSGAVASFTIGDVVSPDAVAVTRQTGPELAVRGRIVYLSDSGPLKNHFAVIDVAGIHTPLVVPVEKLQVNPAHDGEVEVSADARGALRIVRDVESPDSAPR